MFERYTENARRTIFFARYEASQFGSREITTEHLLLGLLRNDIVFMTRFLPPDSEPSIRKQIEAHVPAAKPLPTSVDLPLSQECKRVLPYAAEEAERLSGGHIGNEHLLLGILREKKCFAAKILRDYGLTPSSVRQELSRSGSPGPRPRPSPRDMPEDIPITQGALWGGGYVRKAQSLARIFHWEKRRCEPRDALVERESGRMALDVGQSYDPAQFDRVKGGWTQYHCVICWKDLYWPDSEHVMGFTNGQDWICDTCFENFVRAQAQG
jgi:hypothetical protein